MGVIQARIQTVEAIYELVWTAVASRRPIKAIYKKHPCLFCPANGEVVYPIAPRLTMSLLSTPPFRPYSMR